MAHPEAITMLRFKASVAESPALLKAQMEEKVLTLSGSSHCIT